MSETRKHDDTDHTQAEQAPRHTKQAVADLIQDKINGVTTEPTTRIFLVPEGVYRQLIVLERFENHLRPTRGGKTVMAIGTIFTTNASAQAGSTNEYRVVEDADGPDGFDVLFLDDQALVRENQLEPALHPGSLAVQSVFEDNPLTETAGRAFIDMVTPARPPRG
jgi:hypothetical protein